MEIWTEEDERQLLALQVRRKVTHERNAERLMGRYRLVRDEAP